MNIENKLELVAQLFKSTFCRKFIVYGSNIICLTGNSVDIARDYNPDLFDMVEEQFCITDVMARFFNPACPYTFETCYTIRECKFYMCSYWRFQVILTATRCYGIKCDFRYNVDKNKIDEYMVLHPRNSSDMYRDCILMFGDAVSLMSKVGPDVTRFSSPGNATVISWLKGRWIHLSDIGEADVLALHVTLKEIDYRICDLAYITSMYGVFDVTTDAEVYAVLKASYSFQDDFYDYISEISD